MRDLITGLLELARGDANQVKSPVQVDELAEELVERARNRFPSVKFAADLEQTTVSGVPERLERAVWNLLENAGKWSPAGATVEVTLSNGELRVRDHGPGIAPGDRVHVFDRFYRSDAARSLPGSGLGLAIVREVAESAWRRGLGRRGARRRRAPSPAPNKLLERAHLALLSWKSFIEALPGGSSGLGARSPLERVPGLTAASGERCRRALRVRVPHRRSPRHRPPTDPPRDPRRRRRPPQSS